MLRRCNSVHPSGSTFATRALACYSEQSTYEMAPSDMWLCLTPLHTPCRANGVPVLPDWRRTPPEASMEPKMDFGIALGQPEQRRTPRLVLNHYILRSWQDYRLRQERAKGDGKFAAKKNRGHQFFNDMNKCDLALACVRSAFTCLARGIGASDIHGKCVDAVQTF